MTTLIITEKPSQARAVADALGIKSKPQNGSITGNGKVITWCIGHLVGLYMPEDYDAKYKSWNPSELPIIPEEIKLKAMKNTKDQWKVVSSLLKSKEFSEVVNSTDSGREGELIFHNVYTLSGSTLPVKRLWTASLTEEAIKKAFNNLKPGSEYHGLRDAACCRAEADWLIGLNATRLETLSARSAGKNDGVYPVGRVQTPTLALIVNREAEIKNFKPEDFWTLEASFNQNGQTYTGQWFKGNDTRFKTESDASEIKGKVNGKNGNITTLEEKEEKKKSPNLYDLTTLQREANIKFGFSADKTLQIAQSLYENHKVTSYPRTSSAYLTKGEGAELPSIIEKLKQMETYKPLIEAKSFSETPKRFVNESKVEDHHAIIPTGEIPKSSMNDDEKKIFDMIFRRSLAAFYSDRIDSVTKIVTTVENETFKSNGRVIKEQGWWAINPTSEKKKDNLLPKLEKESPVLAEKVESKKSQTTPPPRYTEASLLQKMENAGRDLDDKALKDAMKDSGLGTPATRASIIEGLKYRQLIGTIGKNLAPSEKGVDLINQIPDGPLKSPELTGEWENKLNLMAKGQYDKESFMSEIKELTRSIVDTRKGSIKLPEHEIKENGSCPKCQSTLHLKSFKNNFYVTCSSDDCKLTYSSNESGKPAGGTCIEDGCNGPVTITKNGSKLCVLCESWQNEKPKEIGNCPKCKEAPLTLREYQGSHYVKCDPCNLSYATDKTGKAKGGSCKECSGPVKLTKSGSKICVLCETWQSPPKAKKKAGSYGKRKSRSASM